jgi:hypothetical protein
MNEEVYDWFRVSTDGTRPNIWCGHCGPTVDLGDLAIWEACMGHLYIYPGNRWYSRVLGDDVHVCADPGPLWELDEFGALYQVGASMGPNIVGNLRQELAGI